MRDPGRAPAARAQGGAIGAAGALAAGYGAAWSGHADGVLLTAAVAAIVGALLGCLTWGLFEPEPARPTWWFTALFGGVVGMLAGAFAGFPVGAVFGASGGALGSVAVVAVWRAVGSPRTALGLQSRALISGGAGLMCGLLTALWMAS